MVEEKGKMSAKMEALSAERNSLQQRVDEVGRGDVKNKEEWQKRSELLNRANAELQRSVEEANRDVCWVCHFQSKWEISLRDEHIV